MASLLMVNPRKRRTKRRTSKAVSKRRAPSHRLAAVTTRKTYRRNPIRKAGMVDTFTKGAVGAAGALAVDVAMSKLPIPANLQTEMLAPITRGVVGIGLGMLVAKVGKNKKLGTQLADGAVTVALYSAGKSMIGPKLGLAGADDLMYYGGDDYAMNYYDDDDGMGWNSPANTYNDDFDS